jgi:membrane protein insertase Oxa1/YidC/SpoIIIJ
MKQLSANIHLFDASLLHFVNLDRAAIHSGSGIYWPAMIIVLASAITQYYSSKQLLPSNKESKSLKKILQEANTGTKADQTEVSAAVGKSTRFLIPIMIFLFTVGIPSALSLYWFVGGLIAFLQQGYILRKDEAEMEVIADKNSSKDKKQRQVVPSQILSKKTVETPRKGVRITKKGSK